jgi:hypothetical protein
MASEQTHHRVLLASYLGSPNHHGIYVESETATTTNERWGRLFHVIGSLQSGMAFEVKRAIYPLESPSGESVRHVGWVAHDNFIQRIEGVCANIPPPNKQFDFMRRLFPNEPLRHCQHWVAEVVRALIDSGVLEPLGPLDNGETVFRS